MNIRKQWLGIKACSRVALFLLLLTLQQRHTESAEPDTPAVISLQAVLEKLVEQWSGSVNERVQSLFGVLTLTQGLLLTQPGLPRHVAELQVTGTSAFLSSLLEDSVHIRITDIEAWVVSVTSFLEHHAKHALEASSTLRDPDRGETLRNRKLLVNASASGGSTAAAGSVFGLSGRDQAAFTGLPLVRRVIMAQVLLSWMGPWGRQLPEGTEDVIGEVVDKLYDIHVASVSRRSMVEFLHISMAGGTSFSNVADENGCAMWDHADGNVDALDDQHRWVNVTALQERTGRRKSSRALYGQVERDTRVRGCAARAAHVETEGLRYISNGYTLQGGMQDMYGTHVCPQFTNVVMLREPLERLESHLRYMVLTWADSLEREVREDGPQLGQLLCSNWPNALQEAGLWQDVAPPVADNYMTRSFLGELGFHTPVGSITSEHTALAQALLLQFDMVLDLNAGHAVGDTLLQQGLGWATTLAEVHSHGYDRLAEKKGHEPDRCLPAGQDALVGRGTQGSDVSLYRFSTALNRLDHLFFTITRMRGLDPRDVLDRMLSASELEAVRNEEEPSERCGIVGYAR